MSNLSEVEYTPQVDPVATLYQKKPVKSPLMSQIRDTSDCFKLTLSFYDFGKQTINAATSIQWSRSAHLTDSLIESTKIFSVLGFIANIPLWIKHVKKTSRKHGLQRLNNAIKATYYTSVILSFYKTTISGLTTIGASLFFSRIGFAATYKYIAASSAAAGSLNLLLSPVFVAMDIKNCYQTSKFLKEFSTKVGQKNLSDFATLAAFLENGSDARLSAYFDVDGDTFRTQFIRIKKEILAANDSSRAEKQIEMLRGKVKLTLRNHVAFLVADTVYFLAVGLLLTGASVTIGHVLCGAILATYGGVLVSKIIGNHFFQKELAAVGTP